MAEDTSLAVPITSNGHQQSLDTVGDVWSYGPIVPNPSPFKLEEQIERIMANPSNDVIKTFPGGAYQYLTIGHIETSLLRIFGPGNVRAVSFPEYPQESQSPDGKKIVIMDHIRLFVRWANGQVQTYDGWGEGEYWLNSSKADKGNSYDAAHSFATKSAARRIGPLFGMGLKDAIDAGDINSVSDDAARNIIAEAVGNRLYNQNGTSGDIPLTTVKLGELIKKWSGSDGSASLEGKALQNVAALLATYPTMGDKILLVQRADALGIKGVDVDTAYKDLIIKVRETEESRRVESKKAADSISL